jgi:hypothetical protein
MGCPARNPTKTEHYNKLKNK